MILSYKVKRSKKITARSRLELFEEFMEACEEDRLVNNCMPNNVVFQDFYAKIKHIL